MPDIPRLVNVQVREIGRGWAVRKVVLVQTA